LQIEIWKPVAGYEGYYEVSNLGRVRSLDRYVNGISNGLPARFRRRGRVLRPKNVGPRPYCYLGVTLAKEGDKRTRPIHVLVLETFVGPKPEAKSEGRHLNGDRANCRLDNLAWGTRAENLEDSARHGTRAAGERHGRAKLTDADVLEIRTRVAAKAETQTAIAKRMGICLSLVQKIVRRKNWKHLP
jgi:hypothetical protein